MNLCLMQMKFWRIQILLCSFCFDNQALFLYDDQDERWLWSHWEQQNYWQLQIYQHMPGDSPSSNFDDSFASFGGLYHSNFVLMSKPIYFPYCHLSKIWNSHIDFNFHLSILQVCFPYFLCLICGRFCSLFASILIAILCFTTFLLIFLTLNYSFLI